MSVMVLLAALRAAPRSASGAAARFKPANVHAVARVAVGDMPGALEESCWLPMKVYQATYGRTHSLPDFFMPYSTSKATPAIISCGLALPQLTAAKALCSVDPTEVRCNVGRCWPAMS